MAGIMTSAIVFTTTPNDQYEKQVLAALGGKPSSQTGLGIKNAKREAIYAIEKEVLVGGVIFSSHFDIFWIDSIWVVKEKRKQGLGRALLSEMEIYAKKLDIKEIQLNTYLSSIHQFFTSQGFETLGTIPNWKSGLTCFLMRNLL